MDPRSIWTVAQEVYHDSRLSMSTFETRASSAGSALYKARTEVAQKTQLRRPADCWAKWLLQFGSYLLTIYSIRLSWNRSIHTPAKLANFWDVSSSRSSLSALKALVASFIEKIRQHGRVHTHAGRLSWRTMALFMIRAFNGHHIRASALGGYTMH